MAKLIPFTLVALALGGAAFWGLTIPDRVEPARFAGLTPDPVKGEAVFHAAGCASCHSAPGARGDEKLVLAGGQRFETPFGTFIAPNISTHPTAGIGTWTTEDLANAVLKGVSPEGQHYYPAFPWDSYGGMVPQDLVDLAAFMKTLPASDQASADHEILLPLKLRRGIGLWKLAFGRDGAPVTPADGLTVPELRGRYLVEVLGHCGECHTPRAMTGAIDQARWLKGGPDASGKGRVPDITPAGLGWSAGEISEYLSSGLTPDYDSVGGHMAYVVENYARLPEAERAAVAAYLVRLPPADSAAN